jgi:hypothetical protein
VSAKFYSNRNQAGNAAVDPGVAQPVFAAETRNTFRAAPLEDARDLQPAPLAHGDRLKAGSESRADESEFHFLSPLLFDRFHGITSRPKTCGFRCDHPPVSPI